MGEKAQRRECLQPCALCYPWIPDRPGFFTMQRISTTSMIKPAPMEATSGSLSTEEICGVWKRHPIPTIKRSLLHWHGNNLPTYSMPSSTQSTTYQLHVICLLLTCVARMFVVFILFDFHLILNKLLLQTWDIMPTKWWPRTSTKQSRSFKIHSW